MTTDLKAQESAETFDHVIACQKEVRAIVQKYTTLSNTGLIMGSDAIEHAEVCCDETIEDLFRHYLRSASNVLQVNINEYRNAN